jgi:hypothetical protein
MSPALPPSRPRVQISIWQMLVVVTLVGVALGVYRIAGLEAFVHYGFLIFAVGPWFAHLASECLPIRSRQLRVAIANLILVVLFVATLKMAERIVSGPAPLIVGIAALVLWTPQYLLFLVWRELEPPV